MIHPGQEALVNIQTWGKCINLRTEIYISGLHCRKCCSELFLKYNISWNGESFFTDRAIYASNIDKLHSSREYK